MNCPNCGAHSSRQVVLTEGTRKCGTCNTTYELIEGGANVTKPGQTLLSEVPTGQEYI